MDELIKIINRYKLLVLGSLFILFGFRVIQNPIFFSAKYQRIIDLRPFELPFGLALVFIGILICYFWIKRGRNNNI